LSRMNGRELNLRIAERICGELSWNGQKLTKKEPAMSFEGTVKNGVIVLDEEEKLPEGTRVEVTVKEEEKKPTLLGLLKLAGTLDDLPPDFAAEHDHYIHGTPKRGVKEGSRWATATIFVTPRPSSSAGPSRVAW
jgi:hypothetical protein